MHCWPETNRLPDSISSKDRFIQDHQNIAFWYPQPWQVMCKFSFLISDLFNWNTYLLLFYISFCWSRSFSESLPNQQSGFLVSVGFCFSMTRRSFPGCRASSQRESKQIGPSSSCREHGLLSSCSAWASLSGGFSRCQPGPLGNGGPVAWA